VDVKPGDKLRVLTPGGGGYGSVDDNGVDTSEGSPKAKRAKSGNQKPAMAKKAPRRKAKK
jgi:N-methylhydantoinase B/oxoprolinase/acetone carboxylase alpha subunit